MFELHWFNDAWSGGRETTAVNNSEPGQTATCATALLNASFPQFHLRPAGLGTAIRDAIRDDKIEVESDDFNEAFDVTSEDRRFAVAFLDPGMQSLLLESMQGFGLELRGAWLLVHCKPLPPKAMPGLFGLVDRIVATIPSTVSELYPGPLGADLSTPMPDPYGSLVPPAPIADPAPPPPERDLDGNPVVPRRQDPWGPGRPFPDKTS